MYKDLLQSEKEYEFPKHAGREKRALKSKMAGGGREKGWLSGMTQSFVIYTAGLCPWERQDSGGEHRPWGQPACIQTTAQDLWQLWQITPPFLSSSGKYNYNLFFGSGECLEEHRVSTQEM